jgi:hypothetical protein
MSNLEQHLSTGGPSVKNVYGGHKEIAFKSEVSAINGILIGKPKIIAPGINLYEYSTPSRIAKGDPPLTKATYDTTYTDDQILHMSKRASSQVWTAIQKTGIFPKDPVNVMIDGVPFKVNLSVNNGQFFLYAHPGM